MPDEFLPLRVAKAWDEGPRLRALELAVTGTPLEGAYRTPGQFLRARAGGTDKEAFLALANAPGGPTLELLVQIPDPPDPAKPAARLAALGEGDTVEVTAPGGKGFFVEWERGRDVLLLAGGSGISAIRSVLEYVIAHRKEYGRVMLFFGARTVDDLAYRTNFEQWQAHEVEIEPTLSRPGDVVWQGRIGYVQQAFAELGCDPARLSAFVAGGKDFSAAVTEALTTMGVDPARIFKNF